MTYTDPAVVASVQNAIRAEQNCIYACGLVGAQLRGAGQRRALTQLAQHRLRLQTCSLMIDPTKIPQTPPAFVPPEPITNAASARSAMAALDNALVGLYAQLAASTQGDDRSFAIEAAVSSARSAIQWGAASQAFPTGV